MAQPDGPKLKALRELGQPEIARRFAAADGKPTRAGRAPPPATPVTKRAAPPEVPPAPKRNLLPTAINSTAPAGDGAALQSTAHPVQIPYAKAVRLLTGLTQADFAAAHGFSRRTFEGWERGASEPNAKARAKLAEIEAACRRRK